MGNMRLTRKPVTAKFWRETEEGVKYYFVGDVLTEDPDHWIEQNRAHNEMVKWRKEKLKLLKELEEF